MKYKNVSKYFLIACLVGVLCIALNTNRQIHAQATPLEKKIPEQILPCLPMDRKEPGSEGIIEGAVRYKGRDYYVMYLLHETGSTFEDDKEPLYQWGRFGVMLDAMGCLNLNTIEKSTELGFSSLSDIVPVPVAQEMALEKWKETLGDKGTLEKLKKYILESIKPGPWQMYIFEEDLWALRQLGLDLPDSILSE